MTKTAAVPDRVRRGSFRGVTLLALMTTASALLAPRLAGAQSYFTPLVTPPTSVGACKPVDAHRGPGDVAVTGHRLVLMSAPPGSSREITVFTRPGRTVYSDMAHSMTTVTSSTGGDVTAIIDSLGRVSGYHTRSTRTLPASASQLPKDVNEELRHIRDSTRTSTSRMPLTAAEQARVRSMVAWMGRRCP